MIIDDVDALREWLTDYLSPLCDADPPALAKYCIALIRKEKPVHELKDDMLQQLEVFLQDNTDNFVKKFITVVQDKSYLQNDKPEPNDAPPSIEQRLPKVVKSDHLNGSSMILPEAAPPVSKLTLSDTLPLDGNPPPLTLLTSPPSLSSSVATKKDEVSSKRKDDRERSRGSRSRDRRRSRSRGRSGRSKYDEKRRRVSGYRRSRSVSRSPIRSRSPRHSRYSRTSPARRLNTGFASRRSPSSPVKKSPSPGAVRSRSRSPLSPNKGHAAINSPERSSSPFENRTTEDPLGKTTNGKRKKHRCKDYDEKGYCMRGDQCPFDHGVDPVVLDLSTSSYGMTEATTKVTHGNANSVVTNLSVPPPPHMANRITAAPRLSTTSENAEYTPSDPMLWSNTDTSQPPPDHFFRNPIAPPMHLHPLNQPPPSVNLHLPPPNMQQDRVVVSRELINLGNPQNQARMRHNLAQRLGPPSAPLNNCSLELRKIPSGLNTISHLNSHFEKFGTIVNVQVHHDGDPEAAIITYANHSQANAAYRSTEAVLNNRFIKLFWHNASSANHMSSDIPVQRIPPNHQMRHPNKVLLKKTQRIVTATQLGGRTDLLGKMGGPALGSEAEELPSSPPALPDPDSSTHLSGGTTVKLTAAEIKQQQIDGIREQQKQLAAEVAARQKEDEKRAEAAKLKYQVYERSKQLLEKQMSQMKILVSKLENDKDKLSKQEQKDMLSTMRSLQSSIDVTRNNMKMALAVAMAARPLKKIVPKNPAVEMKKKQLDNEMDVYAATSSPVVRRVSATPSEASQKEEERKQTPLPQSTEANLVKEGSPMKTQKENNDVSVSSSVNSTTTPPAVETKAKEPSKADKKEELERLQARLIELEAQAALRKVQEGNKAPSTKSISNEPTAPVSKANLVDLRPTKLHASGFEPEDKDEVLSHFASLGNVIHFLWDGLTPSITVEYATRKHAEKAMNEGRVLGDRLLTLMWVNESRPLTHSRPVPSTQQYSDLQYKPTQEKQEDSDEEETMPTPAPTAAKPPAAETKTDNDDFLDPEAVLYDGDDDIVELEDDESGERTWRS